MTIIQKIKSFLKDIENISIGYNEMNFTTPDNFDKAQIGYSIDPKGNSLLTGAFGDWEDGWAVIGNDSAGDPIFIDCSQSKLPVMTSPHGEGEWIPVLLANSLDNFKIIIEDIRKLSLNRETPVAIKENPIPKEELKKCLNEIKNNNNLEDIEYWELFLQTE